MRPIAPLLLVSALLLGAGAAAEPSPAAAPDAPTAAATHRVQVDRLRFGVTNLWSPGRLGRRLALGLGWSLPQRWYDADGDLLTERSLLNPGDDLERSGLYFALRF
jgi:hypothetical protein